jgi:hypothetical protein
MNMVRLIDPAAGGGVDGRRGGGAGGGAETRTMGGGAGGEFEILAMGGGGGGVETRTIGGGGGGTLGDGALGRCSASGWLESLNPQCLHRTASIGISRWHAGHVFVLLIVDRPRAGHVYFKSRVAGYQTDRRHSTTTM